MKIQPFLYKNAFQCAAGKMAAICRPDWPVWLPDEITKLVFGRRDVCCKIWKVNRQILSFDWGPVQHKTTCIHDLSLIQHFDCVITTSRGHFYWHGLALIPAGISNYVHYKVCLSQCRLIITKNAHELNMWLLFGDYCFKIGLKGIILTSNKYLYSTIPFMKYQLSLIFNWHIGIFYQLYIVCLTNLWFQCIFSVAYRSGFHYL